jgi:hypothetical protein
MGRPEKYRWWIQTPRTKAITRLLFIDLAQEKHNNQGQKRNKRRLAQFLGHNVRNQGQNQRVLYPGALRVELFANLNIGDRLD